MKSFLRTDLSPVSPAGEIERALASPAAVISLLYKTAPQDSLSEGILGGTGMFCSGGKRLFRALGSDLMRLGLALFQGFRLPPPNDKPLHALTIHTLNLAPL